jgi:selenocysteine-specific elongation factor
MIVGTAGHIDHGKTTLVRALTGVNTDRLKEEQERGISIELGYGYVPLANGEVLGFIDVPGHERLIHTMVAGACGIDFALLVVAADDGVMPQTREHLAILELLGVARGAVALTKADRVEPTRLETVRAEVTALLAPTPLRDAPVFSLNATAPEDPGTWALKHYLSDVATHGGSKDYAGVKLDLFRLAVDRVFTLAGHGTVVTGTVFSGQVRINDTLAVMPRGTSTRVRSIHTQNRAAEHGSAGERCALNLTGIEKSDVRRGDWLADPRALAATTRVDARLRLLARSGLTLATWAPLHFHLGTSRCVAHLVPLEETHLTAGQSALAQLILESPLCAIPGDRFLVRDPQALHTIGGGVVLDPFAPARKRRSPGRMTYLHALERMLAGEGVAVLLQHAPHGMALAELARLSGKASENVRLPADALLIEARPERCVILASCWQALRNRAVEALRAFHAHTPEEAGCESSRLRRIAAPALPEGRWRVLIEELLAEGAIRRSGRWLHLAEHVAVLSGADENLARRLQPLITAGAFDPPWVRELAAALHEPEERVRLVLRKQVTRGAVCQLVRDLFYDSDRIGELAEQVAALARSRGTITPADFRDATELSRKRAIQILEFFDRVGYTRRVGNGHVLRMDGPWGTVSHPVREKTEVPRARVES